MFVLGKFAHQPTLGDSASVNGTDINHYHVYKWHIHGSENQHDHGY